MKKDDQKLPKSMTEIDNFKERFETLMDSLPDVVYALCREGKFVFVNHAVRKLGYTPDDLIGKHFNEVIIPSDGKSCNGSKVLKKFKGKKTGSKGAPKLFDERRTGSRKTSGLEVHLLIKETEGVKTGMPEALTEDSIVTEVVSSGSYLASTKDEEPLFIGSVGVIKDVSEKKKAEADIFHMKEELARKEAESRYFNILEISPDAIVSSGEDGNITQWNKGAEELFGYKKEEVLGKKIAMLIPEWNIEHHVKGFQRIVDGDENQFVRKISEKKALKKNGKTILIEMTLSAIRLKESLHFTAIIRDISARKEAEGNLKKNLEIVERLNNLMAGRELRIAELRKENEYLKCKTEELEKQIENINADK